MAFLGVDPDARALREKRLTALDPKEDTIMAEQGGQKPSSSNDARRETDEAILKRVAQSSGGAAPPQLRIMSKRVGTLTTFWAHKEQTFGQGPLTARDQALISMAAAVVIRSRDCIRVHANAARQAGATEEEIVQTALIAAYVSGTSPLRTAGEAICSE
jgi:AhpD family alkylhydroperoxidase